MNDLNRATANDTNAVDSSQTTGDVKTGDLKLKHGYPLLIEPGGDKHPDLADWLPNNEKFVSNNLNKYGSILFRGFSGKSGEDFQRIVKSYSDRSIEYTERTSPRSKVLDKIYSSTDYPADLVINMHNESSYSAHFPRKLMFFCHISPASGGETPIADSRKILSLLKKSTVDKFVAKGVMYKRTLGTGLGLTWQDAFQTTDKNAVSRLCESSGMNYVWDGDVLKLSWVRPAVQVHPVTGETVWFNHAFFYHRTIAYEESILEVLRDDELPFRSFYGDGSEIELSAIDEVRQAYKQMNVEFPWRTGDLLLVDNLLAAHGRNPFKGPRKILVSIFD